MGALKQKRIRKVFPSDQVIHLWANQSQSDARSNNVFFEGTKIYSYGMHYELGRIVEYNGVRVALVNDTGYSVTTGKHISWAYHGCSHLPCFKLKGFGDEPLKILIREAVLRRQNELIDDLFSHFSTRKFWGEFKYHSIHSESTSEYGIISSINKFNSDCDKLGFTKHKIIVDKTFASLWDDHVKYIFETNRIKEALYNTPEQIAKRENERLKREAKALEVARVAIENWRAGGVLAESVRALRPMLLRVRNNEVETSNGARVPLPHALRLLSLIEKGKVKEGERVGHFTFEKILNDSTIKIGCHTISLVEARNVLGGLKPMLKVVE